MLKYVGPWQPYWMALDLNENKFQKGPYKEHSTKVSDYRPHGNLFQCCRSNNISLDLTVDKGDISFGYNVILQIEDIERHGPPKYYVEDAFEKNHGIIRNYLFLQNQKARSRDIAIKFAKHMLCQHVTSGGFFPDGETW